MSHLRERGWIIGLLFLYLVAAGLVLRIPHTYMREDEEIAFRTTSRDLIFTLRYQVEADVQAPAWFILFWGWQQMAGSTEFSGRVLSILITMLTLAAAYRLARLWTGAPQPGWFAAAVLGVSAYFTIYALEIRPYALVMLLATASMGAFWRWQRRRTPRSALIYGASVAAMLYAHYLLAFLVAVQMIYVWVFERGWRSPALLRQGLGAAASALALWLPWLPAFFNQLATVRAVELASGSARGLAGIGNTTEPTTLQAVGRLLSLASNGQTLLLMLVLLWGAVALRRSRSYGLALLWGLGAPAAALLANLFVAVYTPRYVSYLTVGLGLALGMALATFPARWRWAALVAFTVLNLWTLPSQFPRERIPHRLLFRQISQTARADDVVFFDGLNIGENLLRWQLDHYLTKPDRRQWVTDAAQVGEARRVWHVTDAWFDPVVQAHFRLVERSRPLQQVIGRCDRDWCFLAQLLEGPPQRSPTWFGDQLGFLGADVEADWPAVIAARLWWQVERTPDQDYSIGLHLLAADDTLVAQADGPIADQFSGVTPTLSLVPGRLYIDRRALLVPPDAPPGSYALALVVYDWMTGRRLPLADGQDRLIIWRGDWD